MKKIFWLMALICGLTSSVLADRISVVEITDMFGEKVYEIMTPEEFMKVYKEVQEEKKIFYSVVAEVRKEWQADKNNRAAFPGSYVKSREVKKMIPEFRDEEKAQKRKEKLEERFSARKARDQADDSRKLNKLKGKRRERYLADQQEDAENRMRAIKMVLRKMNARLKREIPTAEIIDLGEPEPAAKKEVKEEAKKDPKKDIKKDAKKDSLKDSKKDTEKNALKDSKKDAEKDPFAGLKKDSKKGSKRNQLNF